MKLQSILLALFLAIAPSLFSQLKLPPVDKSPMDISYCPADYAHLKVQKKVREPLVARIVYSRPQKNGRMIFGDMVEYDEIWRLGANEATEIEFLKDVTIRNNKLKKGRYTMYAIPQQDKWTIIFNKETDTWGAFLYDEKKDALRVDATLTQLEEPAELFTMLFEKQPEGADLVMAWDHVKAVLPIIF